MAQDGVERDRLRDAAEDEERWIERGQLAQERHAAVSAGFGLVVVGLKALVH